MLDKIGEEHDEDLLRRLAAAELHGQTAPRPRAQRENALVAVPVKDVQEAHGAVADVGSPLPGHAGRRNSSPSTTMEMGSSPALTSRNESTPGGRVTSATSFDFS